MTFSDLTELAKAFAARAWNESAELPICRDYALTFLPNFGKEDAIAFVAANLRLFDRHYNTLLLLNCPELWRDWSTADWLSLAELVSPRPCRREYYDTGAFSDIVFLLHWLKIDALELIHRSQLVSNSDKLSILEYCFTYTPFVIGERYQNSWSNSEGCRAILASTRLSLLGERPSLARASETAEDFLTHVKELYLFYGGNPLLTNITRTT